MSDIAAKIDDILESAALQHACSQVAALSLLALDKNSAIAGSLAQSVAEFTQRNMHGIVEHPDSATSLFSRTSRRDSPSGLQSSGEMVAPSPRTM
jgi:hypothetical protein